MECQIHIWMDAGKVLLRLAALIDVFQPLIRELNLCCFSRFSVSNHQVDLAEFVSRKGSWVIAGGLSLGSKVLTTQVLLNLMLSAILIGVIFQARTSKEMFEKLGKWWRSLKKHLVGQHVFKVVVCKRSFQYNFNVLFVKGHFFEVSGDWTTPGEIHFSLFCVCMFFSPMSLLTHSHGVQNDLSGWWMMIHNKFSQQQLGHTPSLIIRRYLVIADPTSSNNHQSNMELRKIPQRFIATLQTSKSRDVQGIDTLDLDSRLAEPFTEGHCTTTESGLHDPL